MKQNEWKEIPDWEGGYVPDGEGYLERSYKNFKLRVYSDGHGHFEADINARGCCERVMRSTNGKYKRYYDYSKIPSDIPGHTSNHKEIVEHDINTVEELASYLVEYVESIDIGNWVKNYEEQDWMKPK